MAAHSDEDVVLIINPAIQDEEEKKEAKFRDQNRNERTGFLCWGRIICGKVVAFFANLLFCCYFWICMKRMLARIFGCLHQALRDKEDQQDLPPYVDPHFYQ